MSSLLKPRLRPEIGNITLPDGTTTTQPFRLERRLRRADNVTRLMIEGHKVIGGDLKQGADGWAGADSLTGLRIRADGGLELSTPITTLISHAPAGDGYITDLDTLAPFIACRVEWGGPEDRNFVLRNITAYLDPANGGAKNVDRWRCELYAVNRIVDPGSALERFELYPLCDPLDVTAGPSAGEVTFDFIDRDVRPMTSGTPVNGGSTLPNPTTYVIIRALTSDGTSATNVGWRRDSTIASLTSGGITMQARSLSQPFGDNLYLDADSPTHGTPYIKLEASVTHAAATVTFSGANQLDLGAVPASAAVVEFTVQGEIPAGASITGEARVATPDAWVPFVDGETAVDIGLAASQTYDIRATLTPPASGDVTPILVTLGVREVTRTDLSHIATAEGGGWGFDPPTLKGSIPEVMITAIQDGERDFRDTITTLLSGTHIGDFWFRIFVGSDDTPRDAWYPIDDFYPDNGEGRGGAMVIRAVNVLGTLRAALPKYDVATEAREVLSYANQTLKAAFNDVQASQLAVPGRHIGAQIEDTTTLVTKRIEDSDGKIELDALAFLAGGTVLGRQGRMDFVDVHGEKGVAAIFGVEDIIQETVTPGWSQRVPEFFVDWGYDPDTREWDGQERGINAPALTKLGHTYLDPPQFLDEEIATWIPTQALAQTVARRQIETLGTGMITISFRTQYPHPELWPGDLVAVRTDRLVARSPTDDREIKGYVWALGVISQREDLWGTRFTVWVRKYSEIIATSNAVTVEATPDPIFTGASYTTEAGPGAGSIAAYNYRNTAQALPAGLWRTALYDDDTWRLQRNTAAAGDFSTLEGVISVGASGALSLNRPLTVSGLVTASAGATVASGQTLTVTGATITGLTAASVGAAAFPASAAYSMSGLLTLSAGLTVSGGTISASGIAATVGALTAASGAFGGASWDGTVAPTIVSDDAALAFTVSSMWGLLRGTSFHRGVWLASNLEYTGSGDPLTNALYVSGDTSSSHGGILAFLRGNSPAFMVATAPTTTGAGDPATLTTRFSVTPGTATFHGDLAVSMGALTAATITGTGLIQTTVTTQQLALRYDVNNHLAVTVSSAGVVTYNATGASAGHVFSDDVTIGSLGRFDGADSPLDLQLLVYHAGATLKWQAESFQLLYSAGDTKAQVQSDGTTVAYLLDDPGSGADSPVGAPPTPTGTPVLTQTHKAMTVDLSAIVAAYSPPADFRYWEVRVSTDNFVGVDELLCYMTGAKAVQGRLDTTTPKTYYYKVRVVDRAGNLSGYSSTASAVAVANDQVSAFGALIASEISVTSLAAINANIGIVTAGQMRNAGNVAGVNLGGAGGIPGGWTMGINFEAGATVSGMTRYLDFAATGSGLFLKCERLHFGVDGVVRMYPTTSAQPVFGLSGSDFWLQNNAATPTQGVLIAGSLPGTWTRYLNLNGSGAMLLHDKLALNYDGTAIFRGVAQETDTSPKFKIDFPNKLLTLTGATYAQVRVGLIGSYYGLQCFNTSGDPTLDTATSSGRLRLQVGGGLTMAPPVQVVHQAYGLSTTSVTEVSISSFSLLANSLTAANDTLRVTLLGRATGGATKTLVVKFGTDTILTAALVGGGFWMVSLYLTRTGTSTQDIRAWLVDGNSSNTMSTASGTQTLTGDITLDIRGKTANAGEPLYVDKAVIEYLPVSF